MDVNQDDLLMAILVVLIELKQRSWVDQRVSQQLGGVSEIRSARMGERRWVVRIECVRRTVNACKLYLTIAATEHE